MAARHRAAPSSPREAERRHLDRRRPVGNPHTPIGPGVLAPLLAALALVAIAFVLLIGEGGTSATFVVVAALFVLAGAGMVVLTAMGARRTATTEPAGLSLDALTGLPNRHGFLTRAAQLLADDRGPVHVARVDLDRFRSVNEAYGTSLGDALLCQAAQILSSVGAFVGRFQGDEFVMVLRGMSSHEVDVALGDVIERLRSADIDGEAVELGCSIAVVRRPDSGAGDEADAPGIEELITETEIAMYRAKRLGRGRLVHADEATRRTLAHLRDGTLGRDLEISVRLQRSLHDRRIVGARIVPQIDDGAAEPLEGRDLQLVADFAGRRFGVLDATLAAIAASGRPIPPAGLRIWFEVSAFDVSLPGGVDALSERLAEFGVSGTPLGVELLAAGDVDIELLERAVSDLRQRGLAVAVPVTGPGAIHVDEVAWLEVDRVLVDADAVDAVNASDPRVAAVVRSLAAMGHHLGIEVMGVAVPSLDAGHRLAELGVGVAQVLLSEPWAARPQPSIAPPSQRA